MLTSYLYFRQLIQEALNKQTYSQFLTYAQNQFPNNPDEVSNDTNINL